MDYQACRQLLADMGIWAPQRPSSRNPTLRWDSRDGQPIGGAYLNATDSDVAYFILSGNCDLREDAELWLHLPDGLVGELDKKHRNILPLSGRERQAFQQLFRPLAGEMSNFER
jgi:hypothetical protein